jgi:hypothetical protein
MARAYETLAGRPSYRSDGLCAMGLWVGPRTVAEALQRIDAFNQHFVVDMHRAVLLAMNDMIDEARALATASEERGRELGKYLAAEIGEIESLAGNHDAAAERYGLLYDWEVGHGLAGAGFSALVRGRELCLAGRYEDAEQCLAEARTYGALDFLEDAVGLQAEALVAAHRGDHAAAERFGREALTYIHETDS